VTAQGLLVGLLLVSGMVALGTVLDVDLLRARLRRPAGTAVVVAVNALVVPALGILAVAAADLDAAVGLGVVLAAAAPGGGTGALLALHARGDVPTAVVLQVVLAAAALVVTPAWVGVHAGAQVDPAPLVVGLLVLQVLPLAAAAVLRRRRPAAAARLHPVARRTADLSLAVLVVGLLVTEVDRLPLVGAEALAVMAGLVLLTLGTVALPVGDGAVRRASAMTTAVRNLSLALLAATYAPDPALTSLAVLAYGLVMYLLCAAAAAVLRR
jgi:bile acid:Na+ symporter, BASS family